jgi:hexokinase
LFTEWLHHCFIPEVKEYLEKKRLPLKVLLIINNATGILSSSASRMKMFRWYFENVQVVF